MAQRALLDVNVLIALFDPDHVHHPRVTDWMMRQVPHGWATCPLTQLGLLRIMSQPAYPHPIGLSVLRASLAKATSHPAHQFWAADISPLDDRLFPPDRLHGHQQLTDAYLLALAVANEGVLATLDQRIPLSAVAGARPHHLQLI
ncbi:TA system VapC family ribonuclease toxin [Amphibiibacter pelophylacis]|uniref:TA system VapC family ribonuclease toxin n=1 Tax=Amphibiibacter pelophylacis TaxID=1799477 RepID=A0ACC6P5W6_9BURK